MLQSKAPLSSIIFISKNGLGHSTVFLENAVIGVGCNINSLLGTEPTCTKIEQK